MLKNKHLTINANDLSVRKRFPELIQCFFVFFRLTIGWHEYGIVDNEKVGMGGRKTVAFLVEIGVGEWKREECVGLSFCGTKSL